MTAKSRVRPHLFQPDPDVPADPITGKRACAAQGCHLMGEPGDARHTLPPAPEGADHGQLAAGEGGEE